MNRIGRSTIICLLIATAPIWALLARKLSSQLLESVTKDGQTKDPPRAEPNGPVRSKKCAALASDLGRGHQHYAGEPRLVPGNESGMIALRSCAGLRPPALGSSKTASA